jgi:hypothetical protein
MNCAVNSGADPKMAERFYPSHSSRRIARPVMKAHGTSLSTLSTVFDQAYSAAALAGDGGLPISGRTRWMLALAVAHESRDEPSCRGLRPLPSPRRRAVDAGSRRHGTQEARMAETAHRTGRSSQRRQCLRPRPSRSTVRSNFPAPGPGVDLQNGRANSVGLRSRCARGRSCPSRAASCAQSCCRFLARLLPVPGCAHHADETGIASCNVADIEKCCSGFWDGRVRMRRIGPRTLRRPSVPPGRKPGAQSNPPPGPANRSSDPARRMSPERFVMAPRFSVPDLRVGHPAKSSGTKPMRTPGVRCVLREPTPSCPEPSACRIRSTRGRPRKCCASAAARRKP